MTRADKRTRRALPIAARFVEVSALLPDGAAKREVKRRLEGPRRADLGLSGGLSWPPVLVPLMIALLLAIGEYVVQPLLIRVPFPMPWLLSRLVEVGVPIAVVLPVGAAMQRSVATRVVREVLNDRGVRVCLGCGYDLRRQPVLDEAGCSEVKCPECGRVSDAAPA